MSNKNFLDLQPGDVVVARDIYSHDYIPYKIKINSVEKDEDFVTETNPKGVHYYGDCLNPANDEYITNVDEANFEEFLYSSVITEITPIVDGNSFKLGHGTNEDGEYDIMVDIPVPGDEKFYFYLMYEDESIKWDLTEEEMAHVKDEIGAYLRCELENNLYFDENDRLDEFKGGWMLFKNGASIDEISNWIKDTFEIPVKEKEGNTTFTSEDFEKTFDDNDVQFEVDDNGEKYISIYTMDTPLVRSLFRSDGRDTVEEYANQAELSYAENYDIDIYTDYYPQTGDVKLLCIFHIDLLPYGDDKDLLVGLNRTIDELDRVDKDGWVSLSQEEKEAISQAAKDYIGKDGLKDFSNWCEEDLLL